MFTLVTVSLLGILCPHEESLEHPNLGGQVDKDLGPSLHLTATHSGWRRRDGIGGKVRERELGVRPGKNHENDNQWMLNRLNILIQEDMWTRILDPASI